MENGWKSCWFSFFVSSFLIHSIVPLLGWNETLPNQSGRLCYQSKQSHRTSRRKAARKSRESSLQFTDFLFEFYTIFQRGVVWRPRKHWFHRGTSRSHSWHYGQKWAYVVFGFCSFWCEFLLLFSPSVFQEDMINYRLTQTSLRRSPYFGCITLI